MKNNNLLIAVVVGILILGTLGFSQDVFAIQTSVPIDTISCDSFTIIGAEKAHEALDDSVGNADDGETLISSGSIGSTCTVQVGSFQDPKDQNDHVIHFRANVLDGQKGIEQIKVRLFVGDKEAYESEKIKIDRDLWKDYATTIPTAKVQGFDYDDLRIELEIISIDINELIQVTQTYLEVPEKPPPKTNQEKLQEILDIQDGFYRMAINANGEGGESFGIYADCSERTLADGTVVNEVPEERCVFSVDAIRFEASSSNPDRDNSQFNNICIDNIVTSGNGMHNCTELNRGDINASIDTGIGIGFAPEGAAGIFARATVKAGFDPKISLGLDVKLTELALTRNIGEWNFHPIGGNILIDSGVGAVSAKKFVIVNLLSRYDNVVEFLGSKPSNMKLIIGFSDRDGEAKCQELDETDKLIDSPDGCPEDFKTALVFVRTSSSGLSSLSTNHQVNIQIGPEDEIILRNVVSVDEIKQKTTEAISEIKALNAGFDRLELFNKMDLSKEVEFLGDIIDFKPDVSEVGLDSADEEIPGTIDKLINLLISELNNKEQREQLLKALLEALDKEDLSSNLEIIADVDEKLNALDDENGPLNTIKKELTSLKTTVSNLTTHFNTITSTLETFFGNLI